MLKRGSFFSEKNKSKSFKGLNFLRIVIYAFYFGAVLCFSPILAQAAIPQYVNYQGKLKDNGGSPVTSATTIQFSIYNHATNGSSTDVASAGGPLLWKETYDQGAGNCAQITPDADGILAQRMGTCVAFPAYLDFTGEYYLGVKIGADAEATPRVPLSTYPYAFTAKNLYAEGEDVNITTNTSGNIILQTAGNAQLTANNTSPALVINQQGSGDLFEIQDNGIASFVVEDGGYVGIGATSLSAQLDIGGGIANFIDGDDDVLVADDLEVDGTVFADSLGDSAGNLGTSGQILSSTGAGLAWIDATSLAVNNIYTSDGALNANRIVTMGANSLTFAGTVGTSAGLLYADDYSANYTNRSLVDKEYVDEQLMWEILPANGGGGGMRIQPKNNSVRQIFVQRDDNSYTQFMVRNDNDAGNGAGAIIELKGSGADYTNNMYIGKYGASFWIPELQDNGAVLTDKTLIIGTASDTEEIHFVTGHSYTNLAPVVVADDEGFRYTSDLSATFVDRTLVDKAYVDGAVIAATNNIYTNNGTLTGNRVVDSLNGYNTSTLTFTGNSRKTIEAIDGSNYGSVFLADSTGLEMYYRNGAVSKGFYFDNSDAIFTDTHNSRGLEYANDYSVNYTNRTLVDKEYVDGQVASLNPTWQDTIDNQMTMTGGYLYTETPSIFFEDDGAQFVIIAKDNQELVIGAQDELYWQFGAGNSTITDHRTGVNQRGVEYALDYSANYTNRTLVDKEYVDSRVGTSIFDADLDTGIQVEANPDEDIIRFTTAGTERMFIQNDGKIGIDTTAPLNAHLQIGQGGHIGAAMSVNGYAGESAIASFRDEDGEDIFTAMGSLADDDFIFAMGDFGGAYDNSYGGYTRIILDQATESYTFGRAQVRFTENETNGQNYVGFLSPSSITTNTIWTLPAADGGSHYLLETDGAGNLGWIDPGTFTNIYTSNGTILSDRTVSIPAGNSLTFDVANTGSLYMGGSNGLGGTSTEYEMEIDGTYGYVGQAVIGSRGSGNSSQLEIWADGTQEYVAMQIYDGTSQSGNFYMKSTGAEYGADYSALNTNNNRWLPDKAYVDSLHTSILDTDGDTGIQVEETADDDTIRFDLAGDEEIVFDANGNIIMNNLAPDASSYIKIGTTTGISLGVDSGGKYLFHNQGSPNLYIGISSSFNTLFRSSGNVGIGNVNGGTNNPLSKLHINSEAVNTSAILTLENTAGDIQMFRTDATPESSITGSIGDLAFDGTNGEVYIKHSGSVTNTGWTKILTANTIGIDDLSDAQNDSTNDNLFLGQAGFTGTFYNNYNTALGIEAFDNPNSNNSQTFYGDHNTAIGYQSLTNNTTGAYNSTVGSFSLVTNTSGSYNTAQGNRTLYSNLNGDGNTTQGATSLFSNISGNNNTAQGLSSLYSNVGGNNNTAQGYASLHSNEDGTYNVAQGSEAGRYISNGNANTSGSYNVFLGARTRALSNSDENEIVIGYNTTGLGSNTVMLGNNSIITTVLKGNVGIGVNAPTAQLHTTGTVRFQNFGAGTLTTDANGNISVSSDERLKNIQGVFNRGLEELMNINPIEYKWKDETGYDTENSYYGFSAQNVKLFIPEAVGEDKQGYLTLSDRPILATAINAIKEQQGVISENVLSIEALDALINDQGVEMDNLEVMGMRIDSNSRNLINLTTQLAEVEYRVSNIEDQLEDLPKTSEDGGMLNEEKITELLDFVEVSSDDENKPFATFTDGIWKVVKDTVFGAEAIFEETVAFLGQVTFMDRVTFADKDMAGMAIIKKGDKQIEIEFEKEFVLTPYVTATANNDYVLFKVDGVTEKGFKIKIKEKAEKDLQFTWHALAVEGGQVLDINENEENKNENANEIKKEGEDKQGEDKQGDKQPSDKRVIINNDEREGDEAEKEIIESSTENIENTTEMENNESVAQIEEVDSFQERDEDKLESENKNEDVITDINKVVESEEGVIETSDDIIERN